DSAFRSCLNNSNLKFAASQGIPYQPYRPRPGIVLDDPDFKPHGSRYRPPDAPVITAAETHLPGYGEIFDVTVSAIQGPGEKGGSGK
ncbi:jg22695, partial [Pararge aegeria aegeria]